jgi:hypothetical protein
MAMIAVALAYGLLRIDHDLVRLLDDDDSVAVDVKPLKPYVPKGPPDWGKSSIVVNYI